MKVVIPWVCVFALLVGCFYLYSTTKEDEKEIAKLHQDDEELANLRLETQDLKQLKVNSDELAQLRKEHEELLRLRSESGQLKTQVKQLTAQLNTAKVQNAVAERQQRDSTDLAAENKALRTQNEQFQQKEAQANSATCIRNLHLIESAKELWANQNQKQPGSVPTAADITPYFPNGTFPVCPNGGTYTINALGFAPTCSVVGHSLPKQ